MNMKNKYDSSQYFDFKKEYYLKSIFFINFFHNSSVFILKLGQYKKVTNIQQVNIDNENYKKDIKSCVFEIIINQCESRLILYNKNGQLT